MLLKIQNMMDINMYLLTMVYKFFDKKTSGETNKNEIISNKELAQEYHKPIIKKFK